jgi:hypothetical protein
MGKSRQRRQNFPQLDCAHMRACEIWGAKLRLTEPLRESCFTNPLADNWRQVITWRAAAERTSSSSHLRATVFHLPKQPAQRIPRDHRRRIDEKGLVASACSPGDATPWPGGRCRRRTWRIAAGMLLVNWGYEMRRLLLMVLPISWSTLVLSEVLKPILA